jgi:hypothetical protein
MPVTVLRSRWTKLASAARRERDPRKFIYLVKQLYDLLNYGEEEDKKRRPGGRRKIGSGSARAKLAERKCMAA